MVGGGGTSKNVSVENEKNLGGLDPTLLYGVTDY